MGRTDPFIAGFEKAAAFNVGSIIPGVKKLFGTGSIGKTPLSTEQVKTLRKNTPKKPRTKRSGPVTPPTTTPLTKAQKTKLQKNTRKQKAAPSANPIMKVGPQVTPAANANVKPVKPKTSPTQQQPGFTERIRQSLTSPGNRIRTYAGMGLVGAGTLAYGGKKLLDSTIGPSRPQSDW